MPGHIRADSGIYQYASDDPRSPMHDVLNLLSDSIHNAQLGNEAALSQMLAIVQKLEQDTAPAFARVGLNSDWNQTTDGATVPLRNELQVAGGLVVEDDGIRVELAGSYQVSFDAVVQQAGANLYRNVTIQKNAAAINQGTFSASTTGTNAYVNISMPVVLAQGDLITIVATGSPSALPSTWLENRTRLSVVRL